MVNTENIRVDISIPDNAAETISIVVSGNKEDDSVACVFPDAVDGVDEVSLTITAVWDNGNDETTITITFPADGIGKTGKYTIVYAPSGSEPEFLQVGIYVRDELAKTCTPST